MITNEDLDKAGYRKWDNRGRLQHRYSDYFYQKKFTDKDGIKYFIEFIHYPEIEDKMPESWMMEMNNNEPHMTFQIHRPDSIEESENRCETFFRCMGCQYYELYHQQKS